MRIKLMMGLAMAGLLITAGADAASRKPLEPPKSFQQCKACHKTVKGKKFGIGPNLYGLRYRKAGSVDGYKRYVALKNARFVWTRSLLDEWLADPKVFSKRRNLPKTHMTATVKSAADRKVLVKFLWSNN